MPGRVGRDPLRGVPRLASALALAELPTSAAEFLFWLSDELLSSCDVGEEVRANSGPGRDNERRLDKENETYAYSNHKAIS